METRCEVHLRRLKTNGGRRWPRTGGYVHPGVFTMATSSPEAGPACAAVATATAPAVSGPSAAETSPSAAAAAAALLRLLRGAAAAGAGASAWRPGRRRGVSKRVKGDTLSWLACAARQTGDVPHLQESRLRSSHRGGHLCRASGRIAAEPRFQALVFLAQRRADAGKV